MYKYIHCQKSTNVTGTYKLISYTNIWEFVSQKGGECLSRVLDLTS